MPKINEINHPTSDVVVGYQVYCAGCKTFHYINTATKNDDGAQWALSGSLDCPTFTPSVNIAWVI